MSKNSFILKNCNKWWQNGLYTKASYFMQKLLHTLCKNQLKINSKWILDLYIKHKTNSSRGW